MTATLKKKRTYSKPKAAPSRNFRINKCFRMLPRDITYVKTTKKRTGLPESKIIEHAIDLHRNHND